MADIASIAMSRGAVGVYLDGSGTPVVVMPSTLIPALSAKDLAPPGVSVRVQVTDIGSNTQRRIHDDLVSLRQALAANYSYAFYFDLPTASMIVQTDAPATDFSAVTAKYPGHVTIQTGAVGGVTYDRQRDASPFWGGARVYSSGMAGGDHLCSTGFKAKGRTGTATYMSTAGHCFTLNTRVYSGAGFLEGRITGRNYPTYEIEWIYGGSYAAVIYNGVAGDDTSSVYVYGRKYAWTGQSGYCRTGYASGRKCDWTVGGTDASFCLATIPLTCTDNLYAFSGTASLQGDSGGPVYYPYNGGALITGSIVGNWSTPFGTTNYSTKAAESLNAWRLDLACVGTCVVQP